MARIWQTCAAADTVIILAGKLFIISILVDVIEVIENKSSSVCFLSILTVQTNFIRFVLAGED